jgi:hypothetical protein
VGLTSGKSILHLSFTTYKLWKVFKTHFVSLALIVSSVTFFSFKPWKAKYVSMKKKKKSF